MKSFYLTGTVSHIRIAEVFDDIWQNHSVIEPSKIVGKNLTVNITTDADMIAHATLESSREPFKQEIIKQLGLHKQYGSDYTPAAVMEIQPYICFKFVYKSNTPTFTVKKGSIIECTIVDISLYIRQMSHEHMLRFVEAAKFIKSPEFTKITHTDKGHTSIVHGLQGTVVKYKDRTMTLTCGYRCIFLKTELDINLYTVMSDLWSSFMWDHPSDGNGSVSRHNNSDRNVFIMLEGYNLEDVVGDEKFVKGCLGQ